MSESAIQRQGMVGRRLGAGLIMCAGVCLVAGLLLVMNARSHRSMTKEDKEAVAFEVSEPPRPVETSRRPPPPPRRPPPAHPPPPAPRLASALSGLDFGLPDLAGPGLDRSMDAVLGDVRSAVMTDDTVDQAPRPLSRVAPQYPPRARARGVTGYVTLRVLVGPDGAVREAGVLEAEPAGYFEEAALASIKQWRFSPGTYQGEAVPVQVRQTLRFNLS